jgi:hypothetical protein
MPDAVIVQAADAVALALNEADPALFVRKFNAEMSFADWDLPLKDSAPYDGRVLVDVVPVPLVPTELETLGTIGYTPSVDVVIRRRLTQDERKADGHFALSELRELTLFVEQIKAFFDAVRLANTDCAWQSAQLLRNYIPNHLHDLHQFTGQIRLTFSTSNDLA